MRIDNPYAFNDVESLEFDTLGNGSIIAKHKTMDTSSVSTEDIFYGRNAQSSKDFRDDTDDTSDSSKEPSPSPSDSACRRHQKYVLILAVLLLLIVGGLGYIIHNVVENTNIQSNQAPSTEESPASSKAPTPTPSLFHDVSNPRPTAPVKPTRRPTSVPTKRPTNLPSVVPSISDYVHLLELLSYTTSEKTIEAIGLQGSPQQKAYEWLHKDPFYFAYTTTSKIQRFALAVLYFSTASTTTSREALETWMHYGTHECSWFTSWYDNRLPCSSDGIVKFLALRNIKLNGSLPSELGVLTHLVALVLNDNSLTGTIPQEFGEWSTLEVLDLHGNLLSGRIPNWNNVQRLREINLSENMLTGYVPASIGNLNITSLDLSQNPNLQGVMPFELCALSNQINVLVADCDMVYCFCCTRCETRSPSAPFVTFPPTPAQVLTASPSSQPRTFPVDSGTPVPTIQIATPQPSTFPVNSGTPVPTIQVATPQPSRFPVDNGTAAPTTHLASPQPTSNPFCLDIIRTSKQCYMVGEPIDVVYSNCNPTYTDWIGIYGFETPENALFDPLLSHRTCINDPCTGIQQSSAILFDHTARGNWPLPSGTYNLFMIRGGSAVGPHTFFSRTLFITISETSCW